MSLLMQELMFLFHLVHESSWGQAIEWPEAWRQSKTPPKPTDGSDKKKG